MSPCPEQVSGSVQGLLSCLYILPRDAEPTLNQVQGSMTIHSLQSSVFSEHVIVRLTHSIVLSNPWQSSDIVYELDKAQVRRTHCPCRIPSQEFFFYILERDKKHA